MKDLKNLAYFEELLSQANNELVRQGQQKGDLALGNVCSLIPEVLLNLPGCFSVRLRAPYIGSMEIGTYYMTSMSCEYCRAVLELAEEGGLQFLDAILAPDACAMMNRCVENIEHQNLCTKERFFVEYSDVPMKSDPTALKHYVKQMRIHVLEPLSARYGVDISDAALQKAVAQHNEVCRIITQIGDFRKEENPRITGHEFHILCTASYCCPKDLLVGKLQETLDEIKTREPDKKPATRVRVALIGSEIDDPNVIKLIEESGALVVVDRFCFGSFPGRQEIVLNDHEDALTQICRQYLAEGQCPRFMDTAKIQERRQYVDTLAKEYRVDGLIYQQIKFCDYWGYERAAGSHFMNEEYGYPTLSIDRPYAIGMSGQLRTRVQAFVESIEFKKLQEVKN